MTVPRSKTWCDSARFCRLTRMYVTVEFNNARTGSKLAFVFMKNFERRHLCCKSIFRPPQNFWTGRGTHFSNCSFFTQRKVTCLRCTLGTAFFCLMFLWSTKKCGTKTWPLQPRKTSQRGCENWALSLKSRSSLSDFEWPFILIDLQPPRSRIY